MEKPKLLKVNGAKLISANKFLPNPLRPEQTVIVLEDDGGQYIKVKHGKAVSVFSRCYFKEIE